jgi:hypothetical protein
MRRPSRFKSSSAMPSMWCSLNVSIDRQGKSKNGSKLEQAQRGGEARRSLGGSRSRAWAQRFMSYPAGQLFGLSSFILVNLQRPRPRWTSGRRLRTRSVMCGVRRKGGRVNERGGGRCKVLCYIVLRSKHIDTRIPTI